MLGYQRNCTFCGVSFAPGHSRKKQCSTRCFALSRIHKEEGPDACWTWTGTNNGNGYGVIQLSRGNFVRAHRAIYEFFVGDIPEGKFLCHRCDNPQCVNPAHLFPGSAADNTRDMISKGRQQDYSSAPKGSDHHAAKLSVADVQAIRASSASTKELSAQYGVNIWSIQNVRARRTWKHL